MRITFIVLLSLITQVNVLAQTDSTKSVLLNNNYPTSINKARLRTLEYGTAAIYTAGMYNLARVWFFHNEKSAFHFANDNGHWMQMDKIGHATTANSIAEKLYYGYRWAGMEHKKATWKAGILSLAMVTSIDVMDGFSSAWGFSPGDLLANSTGAALVVGQNLLFGKQKMIIKWSYRHTPEVDANPADLGDHWSNEWLHNYNGQTYWFTFNANDWIQPAKTWQKVLGIAIGKGSQGMLLETRSLEQDSLGGKYAYADRYNQWYLSLDLDLTHIPTRSKVLKKVFYLTKFFKTPLPTMMYSRIEGLQFKALYF